MNVKSVIWGIILIEVASKGSVTGLQCYVCEDCNEYEDFKELHICGEVPAEMTLPTITGGGTTTRNPVKRTSVASSSSKPTERTTLDDYLYEDGDDRHDASQNFNPKNVTRKDSTRTSTTVGLTTASGASLATQRPTTLTEPVTNPTTDLSLVTNSGTTAIQESLAVTKPATSAATVASTTNKPVPDYDDYMEYEDALIMRTTKVKSLLKISEPVCYMMRYHANNTIITNRGCTTFINANKYSTCQSLYNGAAMESCRICSTNGCNKFLDDDGFEDNDGVLFNAAAAARQHCVILILLLGVIFGRAFI